jgi:predicted nuclease of restriction endonuclease-like (RecB) superfamily
MTTELTENKHYISTLEDIKHKVKTAQIKAHLSVNKEMITLYWHIGNIILERQNKFGWGASVIDNLSKDLQREFHTMKGFSSRNLRDMKVFASEYLNIFDDSIKEENLIWQQLVANLPWGHNIKLMSSVKDKAERLWYAQKIIENGWSRNVLSMQIETNLYERQAKNELKTNNFALTLPQEDSDLVSEIFKDEYNFEFIDNKEGLLKERAIEKALIDDIIKFLTELGKGFAFVGKQYHLEVAGEDFYIDLLFYHIKLKSYIVIELKTTKFKPEYVGKMGFYLACVDDYLKDDKDSNSIGIILCHDDNTNKEIKNKSLQCMIRPIGVSNYKLAKQEELPKELKPLEELKKLL